MVLSTGYRQMFIAARTPPFPLLHASSSFLMLQVYTYAVFVNTGEALHVHKLFSPRGLRTEVGVKNGFFWDAMPCGSFSMRRLLVTTNVVPTSLILVTLMMEAISSSETSVLTRATLHNIPEVVILRSPRRENFKCNRSWCDNFLSFWSCVSDSEYSV
jgi:hypothetical protein